MQAGGCAKIANMVSFGDSEMLENLDIARLALKLSLIVRVVQLEKLTSKNQEINVSSA